MAAAALADGHDVRLIDRQHAEHLREAEYLLPPRADGTGRRPARKELYVHVPARRRA